MFEETVLANNQPTKKEKPGDRFQVYLDKIASELQKLDPIRLAKLILHDVRILKMAVDETIFLYKKHNGILDQTKKLNEGAMDGLELSAASFADFKETLAKEAAFVSFFGQVLYPQTKIEKVEALIAIRHKIHDVSLASARFFIDINPENFHILRNCSISLQDIFQFFELTCWSYDLENIQLNGTEAMMLFNHLKNADRLEGLFETNELAVTLSQDAKTLIIKNRSKKPYGKLAERRQLPTNPKTDHGYGTFIIMSLADLEGIEVSHQEEAVVNNDKQYFINWFSFTKATGWKAAAI